MRGRESGDGQCHAWYGIPGDCLHGQGKEKKAVVACRSGGAGRPATDFDCLVGNPFLPPPCEGKNTKRLTAFLFLHTQPPEYQEISHHDLRNMIGCLTPRTFLAELLVSVKVFLLGR